jgi:adenosine kinase
MNNKQILVTGSVAYDKIMNFPGYFKDEILPDKIHILNVSFFLKDLQESFGGVAGNIAYNLSLLNQPVAIGCNVGKKDFLPYQGYLKKLGINTSLLNQVDKIDTATAYIITDQADNQISGFYPGAMNSAWSKYFQTKIDAKKYRLAIVSPQNPIDMVKLPKIFYQNKIDYIFDPGQQTASLDKPALISGIKNCYGLIGNDYEISLILKKTGLSIKNILQKSKFVITTFGEKGSLIQTAEKDYQIPVCKVKKAVDPTGAGDAYRAGLIYGLIHNWEFDQTGKFASAVASFAVEKKGTQNHRFNLGQVNKRYELFKK